MGDTPKKRERRCTDREAWTTLRAVWREMAEDERHPPQTLDDELRRQQRIQLRYDTLVALAPRMLPGVPLNDAIYRLASLGNYLEHYGGGFGR